MIRNVQALRFVASLWVAVFHLNLLFSLDLDARWLTVIVESGYAGVDLFFVISGYIMAMITADVRSPRRDATLFLSRRFARIYCGWWPFFMIYLAYYALTQGIAPEKRLLSSFFLLPTLLPHHLLPLAWTLSFELFFYVCTAVLIAWNRSRVVPVMLTWAVVVIALNALWLAAGRYHPDQLAEVTISQWFFFYPLTLEFIGGFVLHEGLQRAGPGRWLPWAAAAAVFAVVIFLYKHFGTFHLSGLAGLYHAPERAFLWGGFSICLVAAAVRLESRGVRPGPGAETIGNASYSIYLGHILLIELFIGIHAHLAGLQIPRSLLAVLFLAAMSVLLLTYYVWVERPLYGAVKRVLRGLAGPLPDVRA